MKSTSTVAILLSTFSLVAVGAVSVSHAELQSKSSQGLRLLSLEENADPVWKTEDEKLELMRAHVNFFDVTEVFDPDAPLIAVAKAPAITYPSPSKQSTVNPILSTVSIPNMQSYLGNLTAFNNRYYRSSTGQAASAWIRDTIAAIANTKPQIGASVAQFNHSFVEPSVIAKIPGKNAAAPITILGAHMDSINLNNPTSGRAPGADDDGTGSVNLIEAFRALIAANFTPATPVEFHWYAGEEGGLLGSQAIAVNYKNAGKQVHAMLQLDMTAYFRPGTKEVIALMPDFISEDLNTFMKTLIDTYSKLPWAISAKCGYACSDHASWFNQGYPTALPFETRFGEDNPTIHSANDTTTVNGFSWTHTLEYAKIAAAFAVELAG